MDLITVLAYIILIGMQGIIIDILQDIRIEIINIKNVTASTYLYMKTKD